MTMKKLLQSKEIIPDSWISMRPGLDRAVAHRVFDNTSFYGHTWEAEKVEVKKRCLYWSADLIWTGSTSQPASAEYYLYVCVAASVECL